MAKFTGGQKLAKVLAQIGNATKGEPAVRVGFLESASYGDGTPVALVATVQEFGAPSRGIPPRPFMRQAIAAHQKEWGPALGKLLNESGFEPDKALSLMGEVIAGQIRESIVKFSGVPLKPATVARKGFDKQLVDSGHLLASVDYEVKR